MSQRATRKRKKQRRHAASGREPAESEAPQVEDDMARGYARSRARDEAARAALEPLGPGERPKAVVVAAGVALFFALSNLIAYAAGVEIRGQRPNLIGILLFTGLMLLAAWGAWNVRYWAVLGMQALLGLIILIFSILAVRFENLLELLIAVTIIASAGTLFWFLVKSMARIQMPERPGSS